MRVTCEKCKAVYAVDDKLIPAKGARAQCPKCKALQIVKRDAPAAPVGPAASAMPASPPAAPAPAPTAAAKPASAFDALLGMVSAAPPQPAAPPPGVPVGDPFGNLSLGPPAGPDPFGPPAGKPPADDPFSALDLGAATAGPPAVSRPAPPASSDPFGPPAKRRGADDPFASLDLGAAPATPPAPSRQPAPAAAADPFADLDLGAGAFAPRAPAPAPRAAPVPAPAPRAPAPAAAAPAPTPSFDDLFGATLPAAAPAAPAAAPVPSGPVVPCRSCKKPLPDPFDAALGICESCRNQEQKAKQAAPAPRPQVVTGGAAAPSAPAAIPDPFAESSDGLELDLPKPGNAAPARPNTNPALAAAAAAAKARAAAPRPAPMRPVSSGGSGKYLALLLVLLVAGAGAYVWFARPAFLFKKVVAKPVLPVVQSRLLDWKLAVMGLQGSAAEHFAKGRKAFLADKPTSYLEAEEEFKAAVVLEPTDLKAVAYYVESYAVGRGDRAPADGLASNRELIQAVIDAEPTMSAARRAKASLQLAAGSQDVAREEASEAARLAGPDEQAEALLTLGTVYLKTSAPIAQEKIDAALKVDKSLRRAWYYRGLANEYGGRFASALADYGERLKLDPDQREALRAQARVFARLGDYQSARKALAQFASKHPNVGEPRVLLVQLAYAVERDLREAERTLRELKNDEAKFDDLDKLQLRSLWAAVARERGDAKGAAAHVDAALKIDPNWAPAHFQKMLLALQAGDAETARQALRACEAKMEDSIRAKEYLGRIEMAAGNHDKALAAFREAQDSAPGRMTPRLNMAAILAKRGDLDQAWTVMHRALAADPTSVSQLRRQVTDYFEAPVDAIRGIPKVFDSADSETNWLAQVYAAVAHYHVGDYERAERGLDRALAADPSSMAALVYRTQLEIDRKQWNRAMTFAKRAIENDRESAVAFYLLARVEEGQRKPDQARTTLLQALQRDPGLAPANTRLGMLALEADKESAKKWLLQALASDPDNLDARVALFKLGY